MNLLAYYILPLTEVNFKKLGKTTQNTWNLKDIKINIAERELECEVYEIDSVPIILWQAKNFLKVKKNFKNILIFNIPKQIITTLLYFQKGSYSKFSPKVKNYIKKYSGLPESSKYIRALYKEDSLREEIEKELDVHLNKDVELLPKPKQEWFLVKEEA